MNNHYQFVLIGAGIASLSAIKSIRQNNPFDKILLVSNEDRLPYKRTQINKYIANGFETNEFAIYDLDYYTQSNVDVLFDEVLDIDTKNEAVIFKENEPIGYGKLLIATGHKISEPQFASVPNHLIFPVITASQSEQLINHTKQGDSYFIVGGGVEGVEIAEQLRKLNKKVCIINRNNFLMHHELSVAASKQLHQTMVNNGVEVLVGDASLLGLGYNNGKVGFVHSNKTYIADGVVVATGSKPNIDLALRAHIKCNQGILANNYFETSIPKIYAAGNVAQLNNDKECHLWHHAEAQGLCAGLNMAGVKTAYNEKPFRLKTEVFGNFYFTLNYKNVSSEHTCVVQEQNGIYRELYFKNNHLSAVVMINDKERAKLYQKAVWEAWDFDQLENVLPL